MWAFEHSGFERTGRGAARRQSLRCGLRDAAGRGVAVEPRVTLLLAGATALLGARGYVRRQLSPLLTAARLVLSVCSATPTSRNNYRLCRTRLRPHAIAAPVLGSEGARCVEHSPFRSHVEMDPASLGGLAIGLSCAVTPLAVLVMDRCMYNRSSHNFRNETRDAASRSPDLEPAQGSSSGDSSSPPSFCELRSQPMGTGTYTGQRIRRSAPMPVTADHM